MRDATLKTVILGLMMASLVGLSACGGGEGDTSSADASASESAPVTQDSATETVAEETTPGQTDEAAHPVVLAQGAEIQISDHLDAGKITVIDFYSEYCGPCRRISPYLVKLHQERDDITVVKIDINRPGVRGIDWGSPVAKQYRLKSIPHFQIYDPEGRLLAEGREAMGLLQGYMEGKS